MLELVVVLLLMVEVLLLLLTFDVHWNYFGFAVVSSRACKKGETFQLFLFASMQIAVHPPLPPLGNLQLLLRYAVSGHGLEKLCPCGILHLRSAFLPTVCGSVPCAFPFRVVVNLWFRNY